MMFLKTNQTFILLIFVLAFIMSCGQGDKIKRKELELKERELKLKEKELSLQEDRNIKKHTEIHEDGTTIEEQPSDTVINNWISEAYSSNIKISQSDIGIIEFSIEDYERSPTNELIQKLKKLKGFSNIKPKIRIYPESIKIELSEENESLQFFILKDKFIYTGYYGGSGGETWVYYTKNLKLENSPYTIWNIENNVATITRDYFDPRSSDDPNYQGHISKSGVLDLKTNNITWDN